MRLPGARLLRRKTVRYSAAAGFALGAIVFGSYAAAGAVFCVGLRACPGSWQPYAIVFVLGVLAFTLLATLIGLALRAIYVRYYRDQV